MARSIDRLGILFVLCLVSSAARADALDDARKRVAELVSSATIASGTIELFVGRDVLKTIVDRLGEEPLTANLASRRIDGQIIRGRKTYLEFRSDPSIEGSLTISNMSGNWETARLDWSSLLGRTPVPLHI